jgi:molecular chaperone GrpE (heat shock protein)
MKMADLPMDETSGDTPLTVLERSYMTMKLSSDVISNLRNNISYLENRPLPPDHSDILSDQENTLRLQSEIIENLRADNEKMLIENQKLSLEMSQITAKYNEQQAELEAIRSENKTLSEENKDLKKALEKFPPESLAHYNELTDRMIEFRDQLLYFRDEYAKKEDKAVAEVTVKILEMLFKETGRFMKLCGVEIIDEKGKFNSAYQYIVGTVKTDDPELDETIESTFQPGYIIDGIPKRPQRVMVYVYD